VRYIVWGTVCALEALAGHPLLAAIVAVLLYSCGTPISQSQPEHPHHAATAG
jgi:hypothetical protein